MNIERLPFDQYQRYRLVADLVERLGKASDKPLRVLDVGGRTALLREFLPNERVELVDMEASEAAGLVLGDGSALPFATESFDVVCAFDTLEHVPPERREAFIGEAWRVTSKWVLLAGPYDAPRVRRAERLLARFIKDKLGFEHRYLEEHLSNGLPVRKAVEQQLVQLGGEVLSVGHANLDRWLALMGLELYLDDDPALRTMAGAIFEFYNRSLYASDHATPVYRHVVIGAFGGAPLPDLEGLLDPPVAPKKTLEPFTELSQALMAFDAERALWKTERKIFRSSMEVLECDLEGHRELTIKLREELEARKQVASDLREDLKGHKAALKTERVERKAAEKAARVACAEADSLRAQLAGVQEDLAGHRSALEEARGQLDGWEGSVEELVRDLEGHRGALASAQLERAALEQHAALVARDLEGHRAALAELRDQVNVWERDLAGLAETLAECQRERNTALEVVATLEQDLEGHRAMLEELRTERDAGVASASELAHDLKGHKDSLKEARSRAKQLEKVVSVLEQDLEGHRSALAEMVAERDAASSSVSELAKQLKAEQAELKATRLQNKQLDTTVAKLRRELEGLRATMDEAGAAKSDDECQASALKVAELSKDLRSQKSLLKASLLKVKQLEKAAATLEQDLAGHRAALEQSKQIQKAFEEQARVLESDLEGHRGSLRDLQGERDRALEVAKTLGADLEGHRAALADRDAQLAELRARLDAPEDRDQEHRDPDEQ